jgi:hypothetical protein
MHPGGEKPVGTANHRNGGSGKTVLTDNGPLRIDVPRDRHGTFAFQWPINEMLQQTRFDSRADLETTLLNYLKLYNHHIPQRAIDSKTPILALKEWQKKAGTIR